MLDKFKKLWTDLWKSTLKEHCFIWVIGEKKAKAEL